MHSQQISRIQEKLHETPKLAKEVLSHTTKGAVHEFVLKYGEVGCDARGVQSALDPNVEDY
jgi:hypothetical protein